MFLKIETNLFLKFNILFFQKTKLFFFSEFKIIFSRKRNYIFPEFENISFQNTKLFFFRIPKNIFPEIEITHIFPEIEKYIRKLSGPSTLPYFNDQLECRHGRATSGHTWCSQSVIKAHDDHERQQSIVVDCLHQPSV